LFAALLGYNPLGTMIPHGVLAALPAATAARITSTSFFPQLISAAFHQGLRVIFAVGLVLCLIAAGASWMRGTKYMHEEEGEPTGAGLEPERAAALPLEEPSRHPEGDSRALTPAPVRVAGEGPDGG
jgi:hypothetical protein